MMYGEQSVGVILILDRLQPGVVLRSPERGSPIVSKKLLSETYEPRAASTLWISCMALLIASAWRRAVGPSGSRPATPGYAGAPWAAQISRAKASATSGLVAVSRAA